MNGAIEEAGQTARGVVSGLAGQPVLLGLVMIQLIVIVAVAWLSYQRQAHFDRQLRFVMERCFPKSGD